MKININKLIKSKDYFSSVRQQLLSTFCSILVITDFKKNFSNKELAVLRVILYKLVDDLLFLIVRQRRAGLSKFKEICNFLIHCILLDRYDPNVTLSFKLKRFYYNFYRLSKRQFKKSIGSNQIRKELLITFLNVYRCIQFDVLVDVSSIIQPFTGKFILDRTLREDDGPSMYIIDGLQRSSAMFMRKVKDNICSEPEVEFSLSAGPNGSPACAFVKEDIAALKSYPDLLNNIKEYCSSNNFATIFEDKCFSTDVSVDTHTKIHFLVDKGGKTRNIVMADSITQSVLKPLHKRIFAMLRQLKTDGTFQQEHIVKYVHSALKRNDLKNNFYSIDMKSCTERFPVEIQREILLALGLFKDKHESFL